MRTVLVTKPTTFPIAVENPDELEAAAVAVAKLNAQPHVMFWWTNPDNQAVEEVSDERISKLADLLALIAHMDAEALDAMRAIAKPVWGGAIHRHGCCDSEHAAWPGLEQWNNGQRGAAKHLLDGPGAA